MPSLMLLEGPRLGGPGTVRSSAEVPSRHGMRRLAKAAARFWLNSAKLPYSASAPSDQSAWHETCLVPTHLMRATARRVKHPLLSLHLRRNSMRAILTTCLISAVTMGCAETTQPTASNPGPSRAAAPVDASATPTTNVDRIPDNTAVNKRDANANAKTPIDQNENQKDIDITAKIRRQVLELKDMSINARNAKIITADGKVTLRGPVNSPEERDAIAKIALAVAGEGNVENQLELAATTAATNP